MQLALRPLTHASETGYRNWLHRPKYDASIPKAVSDIRSHALARKTGAGICVKVTALISAASFWSVCQGP